MNIKELFLKLEKLEEDLSNLETNEYNNEKNQKIIKNVFFLKKFISNFRRLLKNKENNFTQEEKREKMKKLLKSHFSKILKEKSFLIDEMKLLEKIHFFEEDKKIFEELTKLKFYIKNSQTKEKSIFCINQIKNKIIQKKGQIDNFEQIFSGLINKHENINDYNKNNLEKKIDEIIENFDFLKIENFDKNNLKLKIKELQKKSYDRKRALKEIFHKLENKNLELNNKKKVLNILKMSLRENLINFGKIDLNFKNQFSDFEKKMKILQNKIGLIKKNLNPKSILKLKISEVNKKSQSNDFVKFRKSVENSNFLSQENKESLLSQKNKKDFYKEKLANFDNRIERISESFKNSNKKSQNRENYEFEENSENGKNFEFEENSKNRNSEDGRNFEFKENSVKKKNSQFISNSVNQENLEFEGKKVNFLKSSRLLKMGIYDLKDNSEKLKNPNIISHEKNIKTKKSTTRILKEEDYQIDFKKNSKNSNKLKFSENSKFQNSQFFLDFKKKIEIELNFQKILISEKTEKIEKLENMLKNDKELLETLENKIEFKEKINKNLEKQIKNLKLGFLEKKQNNKIKNYEKELKLKNREMKKMIENLIYLENREKDLESENLNFRNLLKEKNKENFFVQNQISKMKEKEDYIISEKSINSSNLKKKVKILEKELNFINLKFLKKIQSNLNLKKLNENQSIVILEVKEKIKKKEEDLEKLQNALFELENDFKEISGNNFFNFDKFAKIEEILKKKIDFCFVNEKKIEDLKKKIGFLKKILVDKKIKESLRNKIEGNFEGNFGDEFRNNFEKEKEKNLENKNDFFFKKYFICNTNKYCFTKKNEIEEKQKFDFDFKNNFELFDIDRIFVNFSQIDDHPHFGINELIELKKEYTNKENKLKKDFNEKEINLQKKFIKKEIDLQKEIQKLEEKNEEFNKEIVEYNKEILELKTKISEKQNSDIIISEKQNSDIIILENNNKNFDVEENIKFKKNGKIQSILINNKFEENEEIEKEMKNKEIERELKNKEDFIKDLLEKIKEKEEELEKGKNLLMMKKNQILSFEKNKGEKEKLEIEINLMVVKFEELKEKFENQKNLIKKKSEKKIISIKNILLSKKTDKIVISEKMENSEKEDIENKQYVTIEKIKFLEKNENLENMEFKENTRNLENNIIIEKPVNLENILINEKPPNLENKENLSKLIKKDFSEKLEKYFEKKIISVEENLKIKKNTNLEKKLLFIKNEIILLKEKIIKINNESDNYLSQYKKKCDEIEICEKSNEDLLKENNDFGSHIKDLENQINIITMKNFEKEKLKKNKKIENFQIFIKNSKKVEIPIKIEIPKLAEKSKKLENLKNRITKILPKILEFSKIEKKQKTIKNKLLTIKAFQMKQAGLKMIEKSRNKSQKKLERIREKMMSNKSLPLSKKSVNEKILEKDDIISKLKTVHNSSMIKYDSKMEKLQKIIEENKKKISNQEKIIDKLTKNKKLKNFKNLITENQILKSELEEIEATYKSKLDDLEQKSIIYKDFQKNYFLNIKQNEEKMKKLTSKKNELEDEVKAHKNASLKLVDLIDYFGKKLKIEIRVNSIKKAKKKLDFILENNKLFKDLISFAKEKLVLHQNQEKVVLRIKEVIRKFKNGEIDDFYGLEKSENFEKNQNLENAEIFVKVENEEVCVKFKDLQKNMSDLQNEKIVFEEIICQLEFDKKELKVKIKELIEKIKENREKMDFRDNGGILEKRGNTNFSGFKDNNNFGEFKEKLKGYLFLLFGNILDKNTGNNNLKVLEEIFKILDFTVKEKDEFKGLLEISYLPDKIRKSVEIS